MHRDAKQFRLQVDDLDQLFDDSPPRIEEAPSLAPKLDIWFGERMRELSPRTAPSLHIKVGAERDAAREATATSRIRLYFDRRAGATRHELSQLLREGRISLLIGLGFVGLSLAIAESAIGVLTPERHAVLIRESFVIIGWVALWRPIEIFLYAWWPLLIRVRRFERLARMPVSFGRAD